VTAGCRVRPSTRAHHRHRARPATERSIATEGSLRLPSCCAVAGQALGCTELRRPRFMQRLRRDGPAPRWNTAIVFALPELDPAFTNTPVLSRCRRMMDSPRSRRVDGPAAQSVRSSRISILTTGGVRTLVEKRNSRRAPDWWAVRKSLSRCYPLLGISSNGRVVLYEIRRFSPPILKISFSEPIELILRERAHGVWFHRTPEATAIRSHKNEVGKKTAFGPRWSVVSGGRLGRALFPSSRLRPAK
jgi:hypothetical protein